MNKYILLVLALALATIAAACAPAAAPATSAPTAAASTEANKALARRYVEQVLNAGKLEVLDDILAPNYKRYLSATAAPLTPDQQKQRLAGLRAVFPDLNVTIDDLIAEGDRIVLRMTVRGTHKAAFQGIPPTGKPVTVSAVEVVRVENGKYVEHWGGADNLDLLQQLGAVVSAGPPK